jgi:hypothetical protein
MAIELGTLVCKYRLANGQPATGIVVIQPVNNADDGDIVAVNAPISVGIPEDGNFTATVYIDNDDVTPDLYLKITEKIAGVLHPKPYIIKPVAGENNLATAQRYTVGEISPVGDPSQGPPGQAATITVGSTTTGAAGTNASVSNVGTSSAAILNFTVPRGNQGIQGNQGVQGNPGADGADGSDTNYLWVVVVTGSEARPSVDHVFWVGGETEPTNMQVGDVWLKEVP